MPKKPKKYIIKKKIKEKYTKKNGKPRREEKQMKKIIISILAILVITISIATKVEASSSDLYLNHIDFQAQINSDGSMNITEKWNIKINDTNTLYKTFKIDKEKYSEISNVKVTDITNGSSKPLNKQNQWSYHLPKGNYFGGMNKDNQFEIAWGVGLEDQSATKVYEISYQVKDAISKYSDYGELYWQFIGKDFEIDAKNITGTIMLPSNSKNKEDIKVWGHTEDLNGEIYVTDTNKIEFNINQFRAGRYVEIRTLFPENILGTIKKGENKPRLNQVIEEETTWANQANARRKMKETTKTILTIVINIGASILIIFSIRSIIKNSKKIKTLKKIEPSQKSTYFREIPRKDSTPTQSLSLLTKQIGGFNNSIYLGRIFTATLLDLSLKRILEFTPNEKQVTIEILEQAPQGLAGDEQVVFEFIKKATEKTSGKITTKELEKYIRKSPSSKILKLANNIDSLTEETLYQKGLASKEGKTKKTEATIFAIFLGVSIPFISGIFTILMVSSINVWVMALLMLAVIVQLIVFCILSSKTNVLTQEGVDEHEKWKGLKKYMEDFSMLDKREIPEVVIWESFLVYATAFGIANKVLKQLKIVYPNMSEQWNMNSYGYMYLMLNTNFSSSFSNAITSSMSTAYSSGTGGGGGFSGGGRRPDGGRRRRRRKIAFLPSLTKDRKEKVKIMNQEELYELIDNIPVTPENTGVIGEIKKDLANKDYDAALEKIEFLRKNKKKNPKKEEILKEEDEVEDDEVEVDDQEETEDLEEVEEEGMFPKHLSNKKLERQYIGLLLTDPRYIIKYFYLYQECHFEDSELLNIYKSVIFTEGRSLLIRTCQKRL